MISTEAFVQQCKATASAHDFNDYPFIRISHPIASVTHEHLEREADRVLDEVIQQLLA